LYKYDGFAKDKSFQTLDKVNKYLQSLPKWNKTKYYIKDDDPLFEKLNCETGQPQ